MVSPLILNGGNGPRVFLNISGNVGPGSPNRADDVQLVQLGYASMLLSPQAQGQLNQAERRAFAAVKPGVPYFGAADDPLTVSIRAHEASRGGAQDGLVSVARGASYDGGKHTFIIIALNNAIRDTMIQDFPRVDKHPQCPAALRVSALLILLGGVG